MKYLLTSAGLTNDSIAQALSELLGKPLSDSTVLFIPTAANTEGEDKRWLLRNLHDLEKYILSQLIFSTSLQLNKKCGRKDFKKKM